MIRVLAFAAIGALIAQANVVNLTATLTGRAGVGAMGTGSAKVSVDTDTGRVCYDITAQNLGDITAAHIHRGAVGKEGPPIVPLPLRTQGMKSCVDAGADVAKDVAANPQGFYVNIHTEQQPQGAIRGQLGK